MLLWSLNKKVICSFCIWRSPGAGMTINLHWVGSNYKVRSRYTKFQSSEVDGDWFKEGTILIHWPPTKWLISLRVKEAPQEQKFLLIKHWPSSQMIMSTEIRASLHGVVSPKMTATIINGLGHFGRPYVKSARKVFIVPSFTSQVVMCLISVVIAIDTILKTHHKYWPISEEPSLLLKTQVFKKNCEHLCWWTSIWTSVWYEQIKSM